MLLFYWHEEDDYKLLQIFWKDLTQYSLVSEKNFVSYIKTSETAPDFDNRERKKYNVSMI